MQLEDLATDLTDITDGKHVKDIVQAACERIDMDGCGAIQRSWLETVLQALDPTESSDVNFILDPFSDPQTGMVQYGALIDWLWGAADDVNPNNARCKCGGVVDDAPSRISSDLLEEKLKPPVQILEPQPLVTRACHDSAAAACNSSPKAKEHATVPAELLSRLTQCLEDPRLKLLNVLTRMGAPPGAAASDASTSASGLDITTSSCAQTGPPTPEGSWLDDQAFEAPQLNEPSNLCVITLDETCSRARTKVSTLSSEDLHLQQDREANPLVAGMEGSDSSCGVQWSATADVMERESNSTPNAAASEPELEDTTERPFSRQGARARPSTAGRTRTVCGMENLEHVPVPPPGLRHAAEPTKVVVATSVRTVSYPRDGADEEQTPIEQRSDLPVPNGLPEIYGPEAQEHNAPSQSVSESTTQRVTGVPQNVQFQPCLVELDFGDATLCPTSMARSPVQKQATTNTPIIQKPSTAPALPTPSRGLRQLPQSSNELRAPAEQLEQRARLVSSPPSSTSAAQTSEVGQKVSDACNGDLIPVKPEEPSQLSKREPKASPRLRGTPRSRGESFRHKMSNLIKQSEAIAQEYDRLASEESARQQCERSKRAAWGERLRAAAEEMRNNLACSRMPHCVGDAVPRRGEYTRNPQPYSSLGEKCRTYVAQESPPAKSSSSQTPRPHATPLDSQHKFTTYSSPSPQADGTPFTSTRGAKQGAGKTNVEPTPPASSHEDAWKQLELKLEKGIGPIRFADIPWPPEVGPGAIVLAPRDRHSPFAKRHFTTALRRWHPDKWHRIIELVPAAEKELVMKRVQSIAQSLIQQKACLYNGNLLR